MTVPVGEHVRLWPYAPGVSNPNCLVMLYEAIWAEKALDRLFWGVPPETLRQLASVGNFITLMEQKLVVLSEDMASGALAGCVWFDNIYPNEHAHMSLFVRRRFWGHAAREQTALACRYGIEMLGFKRIFGQTPWRHVIKHSLAIGAKHIATIPNFTVVKGKPHDVYILQKEPD